jgi:hypothetical protein
MKVCCTEVSLKFDSEFLAAAHPYHFYTTDPANATATPAISPALQLKPSPSASNRIALLPIYLWPSDPIPSADALPATGAVR